MVWTNSERESDRPLQTKEKLRVDERVYPVIWWLTKWPLPREKEAFLRVTFTLTINLKTFIINYHLIDQGDLTHNLLKMNFSDNQGLILQTEIINNQSNFSHLRIFKLVQVFLIQLTFN